MEEMIPTQTIPFSLELERGGFWKGSRCHFRCPRRRRRTTESPSGKKYIIMHVS